MNISESKKRFVSAVVTSGLAVGINFLISFTLTPYITNVLGVEAYGFVSLANTIANYAVVITACVNAYANRYISISYHKKNIDKANGYYSSVFYANIIMTISVVLLSLIGILYLDRLIQIPSHLVSDVKLLFLLDILNCMIVSTSTCFTAYSYINNKLNVVNIIRAISYFLQAILLFVVFRLLPSRVSYVGIALVFSSIVILVLNVIVSKKETPDLRLSIKSFSISAVKELFLSGIWNSINNLGNILNHGIDLLLTNLFLNSVAMGQLSIVKTLSTIFSTLFHMVSIPFQPRLLSLFAAENKTEVLNTMIIAAKVCSLLSNVLFGFLIAFGVCFFNIWTPGQDNDVLFVIMTISIVGVVFEGPAYPLYYTYTLTLKNKIPCFITILSGVMNVIMTIVLLRYSDLGVYAVVISTAIVSIGINFIFTPLYVAHCLRIEWYSLYPALLRIIASGIVITLLCVLISKVIVPTTWIQLILVGLICCVVGCVAHISITLNRSELKYIVKK